MTFVDFISTDWSVTPGNHLFLKLVGENLVTALVASILLQSQQMEVNRSDELFYKHL